MPCAVKSVHSGSERSLGSSKLIGRLCVSILCLGSCAEGDLVLPRQSVAEASWFTPQVATLLDREGRLPAGSPLPTDSVSISVADASLYAQAYLTQFATDLEAYLSRDAGFRVRVAELTQCNRTEFISSAYSFFPAGVSERFRATWGPHWLFRYCGPTGAVEVEAVVAASGYRPVLKDRRYPAYEWAGNVQTRGIPRTSIRYPEQEDAARLIAEHGAARVGSLPRRIRLGAGFSPFTHSFSLTEQSVNGTRRTVSVVGPSTATLSVAREDRHVAQHDTLYETSSNGTRTRYVLERSVYTVSTARVATLLGAP